MQPEQSKSFAVEWVASCTHRLRQRWPRVPLETLEEVAGELLTDAELRGLEPAEAAEAWLQRGINS